jgi:uracil phosphoribosyltransferase
MNQVTVIDHPLVQHNLTKLRDKRTEPEAFRRALGVAASLMVYEATRSLAVRMGPVTTPLARSRGAVLKNEILLVPVLRAGLGMLFSILPLIPKARVGFIGMKRHETSLKADSYHHSLPDDLSRCSVILIDPMLATGGSAVAALELLIRRGACDVRLVNLVAAPEGLRRVGERFPSVPVFTAAVDQRLNGRGFIVPGLGDAGDRLFGV